MMISTKYNLSSLEFSFIWFRSTLFNYSFPPNNIKDQLPNLCAWKDLVILCSSFSTSFNPVSPQRKHSPTLL